MKRMLRNAPVLVMGLLVVATIALRGYPVAAEGARTVPMPAVDLPPGQAASATLVLAGGCFWGVQGVYQHVKGVTNAVSGYAGGDKKTAEYEVVSGGRTGHAESVEITYDPRQISYGRLLQIFFSVVHDPTEVNRQGPDTGTQYRTAIFPKPIATKIEPDHAFYPAEGYHQDYLTHNPSQPYIAINDLPKIDDLKRFFPELYRATPVLVAASKSSR
jgi:peptide-methionine (S)-S-oxide reductase